MIILIADDDRLARFAMKNMLMELSISAEYIVLEAVNGLEMYQMCRSYHPEIVFADIQMPFLSGFDVIELCRKEVSQTEFVIVTGFSEFEYAKKALQLGVLDYILKPVNKEQIQNVMEVLLNKIDLKKQKYNSEFRMQILHAFHYYTIRGITETVDEFSFPPGYGYLVYGAVLRQRRYRGEDDLKQQKRLLKIMNHIGAVVIQNRGYYAVVYSSEGIPYFIFGVLDKKFVSELVERKMQENSGYGVVFCLFYFEEDDMRSVFELCEEIDQRFYTALNYRQGSVLPWKQSILGTEDTQVLRHVENILFAWENADAISYKENVNDLYRINKDKNLNINLKMVGSHCSVIMGKEVNSSSFKALCRSFVDLASEMFGNIAAKDNDIIQEAKQYIQENYMKDISISQIADNYGITANYLSTMFRQKVGCKFKEYLTDIRISHAQKLLKQRQSVTVQEIAVMVGYASARHFSKLFQKQTGMTPSIYRKSEL